MGSSDVGNDREARGQGHVESSDACRIFQGGGAMKGTACALKTGNSVGLRNDMGFCDFEGNSFILRPCSMYATRILFFPSKGLEEMTRGHCR